MAKIRCVNAGLLRRGVRGSGLLAMGLLNAALLGGCGDRDAVETPGIGSAQPKSPQLQADGWLAESSRLPARALVVALSNQLSIAAEQQPKHARASYLLRAAKLRERLWRFEQRDTDLREALEIYGQVAKAGLGSAAGCEADRRRVALNAASRHDASALYRGLYLSIERQDAALTDPQTRNRCLASLSGALAPLDSYRPSGLAWQELRAEAAEERSKALRALPSASSVAAAVSANAIASGSASAATPGKPPPDLARGKVQDIVVHPEPAILKGGKSKLSAVKTFSYELGGRLVLSLSEPADYSLGRLAPDAKAGKGHRIYIDLKGVSAKRRKAISSTGLIRNVRFGKRKGGTRVVLDLAAAAYRRVFYLPKPYRVVIDVGSRQAPRRALPSAINAPPNVGASPTKSASLRAVARVTLDPGHGGWDSGAVGPTGLLEKDVALDIAHRAAPALATELGIETMLSRDTDVYVPLEERTARANAFQSDLFISIHCNATESGEAQGVEVYILDPSREVDPHTAELMARENRGGHKLPAAGLGAHVATIAAGLEVGDNSQRSRLLADLLRRSTLASVGRRYPNMKDHGVKTAGFFVLLGSEMPAALFETAFISNPRDEARLATADFRQKLADAVVNAVKAYRDGLR